MEQLTKREEEVMNKFWRMVKKLCLSVDVA